MDYFDLRNLVEKAKKQRENITIISQYIKGKTFVTVIGESIYVPKTLSPWLDHSALIDLATLLNNDGLKATLNGQVGNATLSVEF